MTVKDISYSALFAAFIAICAMITIPTPIVPFSLQPLAITLTALKLSKHQALLAVTVYIIAGLMGLPIFANGSGGLHTIIRPTFGFIIGFLPMAYCINHFKDLKWKGFPFVSILTGIPILYIVAIPYLFFNLTMIQNIDISFSVVISSYCLTFLPTDTISFCIAFWINRRISL